MPTQPTKQYKMLHIYTLCSTTIKTMPSLEAKRFCAQVAAMIYPFINSIETKGLNQFQIEDQVCCGRKIIASEPKEITEKIISKKESVTKAEKVIEQKSDKETQTIVDKDKPPAEKSLSHIRSRSDRSELSFKEKRASDSLLAETDEIVEETIEKYEKCIEALYKQMEDLELEYENKLAESQQNQKIQESHRSVKSSKACSCPVQEMQKEIDKLKKEIKKRDKNRIRKMKVGSKETGKFGVGTNSASVID